MENSRDGSLSTLMENSQDNRSLSSDSSWTPSSDGSHFTLMDHSQDDSSRSSGSSKTAISKGFHSLPLKIKQKLSQADVTSPALAKKVDSSSRDRSRTGFPGTNGNGETHSSTIGVLRDIDSPSSGSSISPNINRSRSSTMTSIKHHLLQVEGDSTAPDLLHQRFQHSYAPCGASVYTSGAVTQTSGGCPETSPFKCDIEKRLPLNTVTSLAIAEFNNNDFSAATALVTLANCKGPGVENNVISTATRGLDRMD
eukprot:jgi/Botrbrau1/14210/Bobra.0291s0015.1